MRRSQLRSRSEPPPPCDRRQLAPDVTLEFDCLLWVTLAKAPPRDTCIKPAVCRLFSHRRADAALGCCSWKAGASMPTALGSHACPSPGCGFQGSSRSDYVAKLNAHDRYSDPQDVQSRLPARRDCKLGHLRPDQRACWAEPSDAVTRSIDGGLTASVGCHSLI